MTGRVKQFGKNKTKQKKTVITVAPRKKSRVVFRPFVEHFLITAKCGSIINKLLFL